MGGCFSCTGPNIEMVGETPKVKQFDYLRPKGTITYTVIRMYDVLEVEINFNNWHKAIVHLWPKSTKMRCSFLNLQRTPQPSPIYSASD